MFYCFTVPTWNKVFLLLLLLCYITCEFRWTTYIFESCGGDFSQIGRDVQKVTNGLIIQANWGNNGTWKIGIGNLNVLGDQNMHGFPTDIYIYSKMITYWSLCFAKACYGS